jgi:hypothetical protein
MTSAEPIVFSFLLSTVHSATGMNRLDRFMPCVVFVPEGECCIRDFQRPYYFGSETYVELVSVVILRFSQKYETGSRQREQRTSYGLYDRASLWMPGQPTRLPGDVAPVDPHQRGASPSSGLSPVNGEAEVIA